jgi:hypothetical protein
MERMASEQRRPAHGRASHTSTACYSRFVVRLPTRPFHFLLPWLSARRWEQWASHLDKGAGLGVSGGWREEARSTDGSGTGDEGGGRNTAATFNWTFCWAALTAAAGTCSMAAHRGRRPEHSSSSIYIVRPVTRIVAHSSPDSRSVCACLCLSAVSLFRSFAPLCLWHRWRRTPPPLDPRSRTLLTTPHPLPPQLLPLPLHHPLLHPLRLLRLPHRPRIRRPRHSPRLLRRDGLRRPTFALDGSIPAFSRRSRTINFHSMRAACNTRKRRG